MPQGHLIITDLSGYTEFLTRSELEHAHEILQSLFDAQLAHIRPPFAISGYRGDAIFMVIPETSAIQPQSILEALENLYKAFASTREQMQFQTSCPCRACRGISLLELKLVAHYGTYVLQRMGDREELLGADVIIPHRMLKNRVVEETGIRAYALFTEAAAAALHLREFVDGLVDYTDSYEHIGEVKMVVYDLSAAWEREKAGRRLMIGPEEAWVRFESEIAAPPALVWDYLTTPALKVQMTGLDFMRRVDGRGGRVGPETRYHCAHGEVQFHYTVVDWRPFDYFTIRQTDTMTGLTYVETYHFLPHKEGTRFLSCVARPEGAVPEGAVPEGMQAMLQGLWEQAYGNIKPFIEGSSRPEKPLADGVR